MRAVLNLLMSAILIRSGFSDLILTQLQHQSLPAQSVQSAVAVSNYVSLIDQQYSLSPEYVPADLIDIAVLVPSAKNQIFMAEEAALALRDMVAAMASDGVDDVIAISGYRSYSYQQTIFENRVAMNLQSMDAQQAWAAAASIVAPPGSSEHQSGLAIDLSTRASGYALDENFADTPAGRWLSAHCWQYGFILRYPEDKQLITGIVYEPWHFRYVGTPHAAAITENGFCLEEYLSHLKNGGNLTLATSEEERYVISAIAQPDYAAEGLRQLSHDGMGGYIATAVAAAPQAEPPVLIPVKASIMLFLGMVIVYQ